MGHDEVGGRDSGEQEEAERASHQPAPTRTVVLRDPRPGDMGWVVQQHGEIYWHEYRFDSEFEGLVAGVAAKYLKNFDPAWEKGWIAGGGGAAAAGGGGVAAGGAAGAAGCCAPAFETATAAIEPAMMTTRARLRAALD